VALKKAIDLGWIDGPRVVPAGHAITPTGGHLDPTMFQALAPHIMPLTVEEGIANGVSEVRKAVRYQIKHGAQLIKVCAQAE
jgi:imidazolonepropionase-like amidohydrolase